MEIQVTLYASFMIGRFKCDVREYTSETTVAQVVNDLNIPEKDLGIILVNGQHTSTDKTLKDGDDLSISPHCGWRLIF